jgi:isohexenylglutaconyl-CoA hydratase
MVDLPQTETLKLERDAEWLTIRLDRPDTRNALSQEMVEELLTLLGTVRGDQSLRGITFRGNNGVFCSGGDLKGFLQTMKADDARQEIVRASRQGGELFASIDSLPQVVLMLVEGAAIAGGLGMICAGDAVFVTEDAQFALTETMIGIPPAQIAPYVARRLGLKVARRIMLTAARFNGKEAVEFGLADRVVANADAFAELEADFRKAVLRCAPGANATTKELLLAAMHLDGADMTGLAAERFADSLLGEEAREGISSFLEKRKPRWAE